MNQASPNINAFLAGSNFSQNGGWGAWFALTTQPQNNPYSLYYTAESELNSRTNTATAQKSTQLATNQGFLSWCSSGSSGSSATTPTNSATKGATNPGDPCVNSDGSTGVIETPGSVIAASTNQSVGAGINKLISAHELDEIISQLAESLITQVVGGGSGGGLAGLSQTSANGSSYLSQYESSATNSTSASNVATLVQTAQTNATAYQAAWNTILTSAQTASSSVQALITCENKKDDGSDPYGALPALNGEVAPVIAQAAVATTNVANLNAMIAQVQNDSNSTVVGANGALAADSQTLAAMPPQASDVASAQTNAEVLNDATSPSSVSLVVSGGSTVDQMNLITTDAGNALNACENPPITR